MPKNDTDYMNEFFDKQLTKLEAIEIVKQKNRYIDRGRNFIEKTEENWGKEFAAVGVLKYALNRLKERVNSDQNSVQLNSENFLDDVNNAINIIKENQSTGGYSLLKNNNNPDKFFLKKQSKLEGFIKELGDDALALHVQMQQPKKCFVM